MASTSRNFILTRRGGGIQDMSNFTLSGGELTLDEADAQGVLKINCKHQVGIATATEVGLSSDRFPVRVVIGDGTTAIPESVTHLAASYWKITNAAWAGIPFARKALPSEEHIRNLYVACADLDDLLWDHVRTEGAHAKTQTYTEDLNANVAAIHALTGVPNPTDEQRAALSTGIVAHIEACTEANVVCRFRVGENAYLCALPAGEELAGLHGRSPSRIALEETIICLKVNRDRLKAKYPDLLDGAITSAAYASAMMFRFGLYESYEHQEYYTINVVPDTNTPRGYRVTHVRRPRNAPDRPELAVGTVIDTSEVMVSKMMIEYSSLLIMISGLMHYLYNHTTGGTIVTGALLSALCLYGHVNSNTTHDEQVKLTSLFYECLHPTNKRALANILFRTSGVHTHGKDSTSRAYEQLSLDSFASIRKNPYPAGSHKAFICVEALKRVLDAGLGPFLPWADQLTSCLTMCEAVLKSGARAHIGSSYYTGESPQVQPSALDSYLPDLAMFVDTFHKGDSLSMSPHLSRDVAKRASVNWQNMLKALKSEDVSATSVDLVREFLATTGAVHFAFDPRNQATWAGAVETARVAAERARRIFA